MKELLAEIDFFYKIQEEIIKDTYPDCEPSEILNDPVRAEIINEDTSLQITDTIEHIKEIVKDEYFYLIGGSAGVWTGNHEYEVQEAGKFDKLHETVVSGKDDAKFKVYKQNEGYFIEAWGIHHDGTNYYEFATLEALTDTQMRNIFEDEVKFSKSDDKYDMIEKIEEYYYYN